MIDRNVFRPVAAFAAVFCLLMVVNDIDKASAQEVAVATQASEVASQLERVPPASAPAFKLSQNTVFLEAARPALESEQAVDHPIRGTVTDAQTGDPIPGVNVVVQGTTTGTTTDADGEYEITVPSDDVVLVFSFIGFQTVETEVDGRTEINVAMGVDIQMLEDVVVVGYGTQRREEITSSIASVGEQNFNQGAVTSSPLQLVQGKVAGLAISRAHGGDPTADVHMLLRGVSTVRGDLTPLIIIDGVPGGDLNTLSPTDIESIDVLRDGSAAAIYGTRGNAGVIIVTTKRGTPGRPSVSYSARTYTESWLNKPRVLNASEWNQMREDFANSGNPTLESSAISIIDYGHDTDWFDAITRDNPFSHEHNLSISGGSETTSYYGSINYRALQGFMRESNNNILNGRLSVMHVGLDDRLTVQASLSNTIRNSTPVNYQTYRQALGRNPTMPVYNEDGSFFEVDGWEMFNPLALLEQYQRDEQYTEFLVNTQLSYELLQGLELAATGAIQNRDLLGGYYESRDSWSSIQGGYMGAASRNARKAMDYTFESTLQYSGDFMDNHSVTAMGGYSFQEFTHENFRASNRFFLTDDFAYNNLGAGLHVQEGNFQNDIGSYKRSNRLVAFFGRVNYNYDDTYMLSASLRHEGSSRFGVGNKWGYFPAVSVGWTISNESFMDNVTFIDHLRLRAGYGVTGNQGIGDYISLERLQPAGLMLYQGMWIPGYAPGSNPNPDLRWERKSEINIGLNLGLIDQRLNITVDAYDRSTTDLLYEYPVPVPPNLYGTLWTNIGEVNNRGVELTLEALPVVTSSFSWRTDFNISYNENKLVTLTDDVFSHSPLDHTALGAPGMSGHNVYRLEEGQPLGNIIGWRHAGFTDDGRWLFWDRTGTEMLTSDEIGHEDRVILGNGLPKSWMGFTNYFNYGNIDLAISLRGAFGFQLVNTRRVFYENRVMVPTNILRSALDIPLVDDPQFSDYYVEQGDYVKLDNITLGYTLPLRSDVVQSVRVSASAQNLATLTAYQGQDPEISIEGLSPGFDQRWIYPSVRTFTLGVQMQF